MSKRPVQTLDTDPALAATAAPNLAAASAVPDLAVASASAGRAASTLTETNASEPQGDAATPDDAPALLGSLLAHYRVDELLGKGAMGEVYLATDIALDRPVALKLLPRRSARDPHYRARFLREARSQARLQHPNICHIYFVGEQNDQLFFAMELIDGETLSERLERMGTIPAADAIEYCRMAALGLKEANRQGYTHRDIKPSNLVVDEHGVVKLVDFGIVKAPNAEGSDDKAIVGTPLYMSPEQARGEAVDFRSDMYSLGVTLHQLVTGAPPFVGDTAAVVMSQQQTGTRPRIEMAEPRAKRRDANLLNELIDRMMAKRPEDRFASYEELLLALERLSPSVTRDAGFWVRFAASAFDFFFIVLLALPATSIWDMAISKPFHRESASGWLPFVLGAFYEIALHATTGQTWGKRLFEIEVVRNHLSGGVGWRTATLRFFVQWGLSFCALFGIASVESFGLDESQQSFVMAVLSIVLVCGPLGFGAIAMQRTHGTTAWDAIAGTRVLYRRVTREL